MRVSVVIPCCNDATTIGEQLDALSQQDYDGDWEVIVADNGSTDASREVVESRRTALPNLTLVAATAKKGVAHARNCGVAAAEGEFLLFCDADDIVDRGWVRAMVAALDKHEFVAGSRDATLLNADWVVGYRPMPQRDGLQRWETDRDVRFAGGGNLGMTRLLYEKLGPFDESFLRLPDTEYCLRAHFEGYTLQFVPDALLHIRMRHSLRGIFRQAVGWAEWGVKIQQHFRGRGLPPPRWLRGLGSWALALPRLARVRSRGDFAAWVFWLGWRVGRVKGSVRFRMLAF